MVRITTLEPMMGMVITGVVLTIFGMILLIAAGFLAVFWGLDSLIMTMGDYIHGQGLGGLSQLILVHVKYQS